MTVCVLGDLNIDLELVLPAAGAEEDAQEARMSGGGSAANVAAALATLGEAARFCGVVGNDSFGESATDSLRRAGVDTSAVRILVGGVTVAVMVVVPPDGDRLIYVWPPTGGAHLDLGPTEALSAVDGASWVHVSGIALRGEPAAESIIAAMRSARDDGATVSLDLNLRLENWGWANGFRQTVSEAVGAAHVVFGSVTDELMPLAEVRETEAALTSLAVDGRVVVGRLGANGSIAHDGSTIVRDAGFPVEVVSTVGAGDAFDAGFIAARIHGQDLAGSIRHANAVAALTVSRPGARDTPTPTEVAAFLATEG